MGSDLGSAHAFGQLSSDERARYCLAARQMVGLAQGSAIPIVFAPPLSVGGQVNAASGCVLQLDFGWFIITASHVLAKYEKRLHEGEKLNWQVGALPPFDPRPCVSWRSFHRDVVFIRVTEAEAKAACGRASWIASAPTGWPPRAPEVGEVVLVSGYPKALQEFDPSGLIGAGPFSAMFRITSTGPGYFYCQIEQKDLVSFDGGPLPPPGADVGGLSGGPVLLMGNVVYPLVGVVVEHHQSYDLLRIATLEGIYENEFR
jgi:hypothetical protein